MVKVTIYHSEFYPFYYLHLPEEESPHEIFDIPDELFERYHKSKEELEKVFKEIEAIYGY